MDFCYSLVLFEKRAFAGRFAGKARPLFGGDIDELIWQLRSEGGRKPSREEHSKDEILMPWEGLF